MIPNVSTPPFLRPPILLFLLFPACGVTALARDDSFLCADNVYQGPEASDAFIAIEYLGEGRIIAGKRSSDASTRFLLRPRGISPALSPQHQWPAGEVNLHRPSLTGWRDVFRAGDRLFASVCCAEGTGNERFMQVFQPTDDDATWGSPGNPFTGHLPDVRQRRSGSVEICCGGGQTAAPIIETGGKP